VSRDTTGRPDRPPSAYLGGHVSPNCDFDEPRCTIHGDSSLSATRVDRHDGAVTVQPIVDAMAVVGVSDTRPVTTRVLDSSDRELGRHVLQ